jgi:hypothetical protein
MTLTSRGRAGRGGCDDFVTATARVAGTDGPCRLPAAVEEQKATALSLGESGLPDGSRQVPEGSVSAAVDLG